MDYSNSFDSFLDKSFGPGICAEDYFASLFTICDTQKTGWVRVSKLLDVLIDFQALDEDLDCSRTSTNSRCESLEILKDILDISDKDPAINLEKFTAGVKAFVRLKTTNNNDRDIRQNYTLSTRLCKQRVIEKPISRPQVQLAKLFQLYNALGNGKHAFSHG